MTVLDALARRIEDAYAMEQDGLRLIDRLIRISDDSLLRAALERHRQESEQQAERLRQRLDACGVAPSSPANAGETRLPELRPGDQRSRGARFSYALEHLEIATYELLERAARLAGDRQTAQVAAQNRREEEAMARTVASRWDPLAEQLIGDAR